MAILKRAANFTDIHFGARADSIQHNEDCLKYLDWVCDTVKSDGEIDHINFLGDWFQQRNSININTNWMSYEGARKLNALGLPIFFLIGNHDLLSTQPQRVFHCQFQRVSKLYHYR